MTREELKAAIVEACLPETMFEVALISVFLWCVIFIGIGLRG